MNDLGCWHLEEGKFVVRVRGNEHLMSGLEVNELIYHLNSVLIDGVQESLGKEYLELRQSNRRKKSGRPAVDLTNLTEALGITAPTLRRI